MCRAKSGTDTGAKSEEETEQKQGEGGGAQQGQKHKMTHKRMSVTLNTEKRSQHRLLGNYTEET